MNVKGIIIVAILVTVFGISLSYATLSQVLEIESVGAVRAANWDIHFDDLSTPTITGDVTINTAPIIVSETTAIQNLDIKFEEVNSSITYYFDVVNEGDLNSKIGLLTIETPICTAITNNDGEAVQREDEANVCGGIEITLQYAGVLTDVAVDDELAPGETKRMVLKIDYQDTRLPINEVSITNLKIAINYVQLD